MYLKYTDQVFREDIMSKMKLNLTADLFAKIELFPLFQVKTKIVNFGVGVNGINFQIFK